MPFVLGMVGALLLPFERFMAFPAEGLVLAGARPIQRLAAPDAALLLTHWRPAFPVQSLYGYSEGPQKLQGPWC